MGYILDIILSLVIRGAIAIAILNMTIALQGKLSEKTVQVNVFGLTTTVSRIMADEMRMVGYNVASPPYFSVAKKDSVEFTYYSPTLGTQRWVKYVAGNASELWNTANPNDRRLYRCDSTAAGLGLRKPVANGIVKMEFYYYDAAGNETTTLANITSLYVHIVMASGESVNGIYPASEWTYRFFPSNIN